jgi:mono/diheme cytochrome c family protein
MLLFALTATLAGGCASSSSGSAAANVSPTDGAALVSALCAQCHPPDRVAVHKDRNGWTNTIARMESHGLQLTDQQRQTIIDYLTRRDGGS